MEQQFYAEVMAQLEIMEYNTNLGIGESGVTTYLHSRRNSRTDGQIRSLDKIFMQKRQVKSS
jgi:hypothetical protein